jgi:outer membrane receptor protein involved in Fe transport
LAYVNVVLKVESDTAFVAGTVTDEEGRFTFAEIAPGSYFLEASVVGYQTSRQQVFVGTLTNYLDLNTILLTESVETLGTIVVTGKQDEVGGHLDKKTYALEDNINQSGGSVLQALQNLPGITVQDGKVQLRGNDRVMILIDGKQTALTGFGNQTGLDNIPSSSLEKIEIINNPSAKYDANGNAGIINLVYRKNKEVGFNGKAGLALGLGSLWERRENLPSIRPQYTRTPKINPSLSLNYRKNKLNAFFQGDYLYTETLNKNEFVERIYEEGNTVNQQSKRNRNTGFTTTKVGLDWNMDQQNTITFSGLLGTEKIIDRGDEPFFNTDLTERLRLWQFLEDEFKTTVIGSAAYRHNFQQPGHSLNVAFNYTFHREDEKYFFDNILPTFTGYDAFKLISDEHVADFLVDYVKPLKSGRIEGGLKFRRRDIPTDMLFIPGLNSPLDTNAGGAATYRETIPALYGNYVFENRQFEAEVGLRVEYVDLQYEVNPNHNTYKSDGYSYFQPFPNVRLAYKLNDANKFSFFFSRRVDRPNEVDIRIFPKYDDAEIIKVGNPALQPQFTTAFELGYKTNLKAGYFYAAMFQRFVEGTITRISSTVPGSNLIYAIFQNAEGSSSTGLEAILSHNASSIFSFNLNLTAYQNRIDAFTAQNLYPRPHTFSADKQEIFSGNLKLNTIFHLPKGLDGQVTGVYLAPDIIPQGKIKSRFSIDLGLKKSLPNGAEFFINATDLFNTLIIEKDIQGEGFKYTSMDYYETQVIRIGYSKKF